MSAPFDQNPWQDPHGPRYGNAYEDESSAAYYVNSYGQPQMPMPMPGYSATGYNNAWNTESNKTEQEPVPQSNFVPQDAYQYSGTAYGNQPQNTGGAYSHVSMNDIHQQESPKKENENTTMDTAGGGGDAYCKPPQLRFWLPLVAFLASIGHLGFAAGARPVKRKGLIILKN
ncbi:hypothetical protein G6F37_004013 [Rhizopus arrhizus]|nr:hypothetical protein G6F38_005686 [Rhizopus arrhizus]KAG1160421.1 hypothetical protein G6F37_004013 [Rhizopus arrhizus]